MRKRPLTPTLETDQVRSTEPLDLESVATVDVTSENADFPIEFALALRETAGCGQPYQELK